MQPPRAGDASARLTSEAGVKHLRKFALPVYSRATTRYRDQIDVGVGDLVGEA